MSGSHKRKITILHVRIEEGSVLAGVNRNNAKVVGYFVWQFPACSIDDGRVLFSRSKQPIDPSGWPRGGLLECFAVGEIGRQCE